MGYRINRNLKPGDMVVVKTVNETRRDWKVVKFDESYAEVEVARVSPQRQVIELVDGRKFRASGSQITTNSNWQYYDRDSVLTYSTVSPEYASAAELERTERRQKTDSDIYNYRYRITSNRYSANTPDEQKDFVENCHAAYAAIVDLLDPETVEKAARQAYLDYESSRIAYLINKLLNLDDRNLAEAANRLEKVAEFVDEKRRRRIEAKARDVAEKEYSNA